MTLAPLLPARHRDGDFFVADIFGGLPIKDDIASMEHPLFTLSMKKDMRVLRYENGPVAVEMRPSDIGLPTIMDKDLLLYCISVMMARVNQGEIPPKTVRLSLHDVLIATNRATNGDGYSSIKAALHRLTGCMLKTSIKTGRVEQGKMFHLLESAEYLESTRVKDRIIGVEITLSDWLYNSVVSQEVLTIDRDYFRLKKPLERRIYEIARKHCGRQKKSWPITLEKLHLKSGSTARLSHFRDTIKKLAQSNHLPEYRLAFEVKKDLVTFRYRGKAVDEQPASLDPSPLPENIPPEWLEDVRERLGTRLDYYMLWGEYRAWPGSAKARNKRAAFIGFCQRKAQR